MNHNKYLNLIIWVLAIFSVVLLALRIVLVFSYLPETGGMSVNMIYGTQHLAQTGVLYINPEEPPFSITQYMPLHYYLVSGLSSMFNSTGDLHNLMIIHRIVCLLAGILYCYLTYWCIRKLFPEAGRAFSTGLGLISFIVIPSINFSRLDNLYLLFHVCAFITFLFYLKNRESSSNSWKHLLIAGLFCALALLTKQTAVLITILLGGWLLIVQRDIKSAFIFSLSVAIPFIAGLMVFMPDDMFTFKMNVVNGLKNGVNFVWFYHVIIKYYFMRFGLFIAFGLYLSIWLIHERRQGMPLFLSVSIFYLLIMATLLALKSGSGPNYYLEFTTAMLFGIACLIQKRPGIHHSYMPLIILWIPFFLLPYANDKGWHYLEEIRNAKKDYKVSRQVADYIEQRLDKDKYILTDFHEESCINLMLCKVALFPCREVAVRFTYPIGVFHFKKFEELLKEDKVQYYIESKDKHKDKFLMASLEKFQPDTLIGRYAIYKWEK